MNYEKALEEFEGDEEFLKEVMDEFFENVTKKLPVIERAIEKKDHETVKKEAHAIKGGAANLTATGLSQKAHELELLGKQKKLNHSRDVLDQLKNEASALKSFFKTI